MSSKALGNPNPMLKSVGNKNGAKIGNLSNCIKPVRGGQRNSNLEKMPKVSAQRIKQIVEKYNKKNANKNLPKVLPAQGQQRKPKKESAIRLSKK